MDKSAYIGKIVEFLPGIQTTEVDYFEPGMFARVKDIFLKEENFTVVTLDVSEFQERNAPFEERNYFDKDGNPTKTAKEAGFFEVCGQHNFEGVKAYPKYFRIVPDSDDVQEIIDAYQARDDKDASYTSWCEGEIIRLKRLIGEKSA